MPYNLAAKKDAPNQAQLRRYAKFIALAGNAYNSRGNIIVFEKFLHYMNARRSLLNEFDLLILASTDVINAAKESIGYLGTGTILYNNNDTLKKLRIYANEAAKQGAKLVLFPAPSNASTRLRLFTHSFC
uniref:Uncharacterized protein n=1 Tax=Parascaris equorum TaxID=6256 RepID=A0A914RTK2_PAREQ